MKIRVAVTEVARNASGEIAQLKVVSHPHWAVYVKDPGQKKLRWIDKGPKYKGAWQETPADIWSAMRRRAYAEAFPRLLKKPKLQEKPLEKVPSVPPKTPQQTYLFPRVV